MVRKFHAIILSVLKFRWFSSYAKVVKNICSCKLFSIIIVNKKAFLYNFKFFCVHDVFAVVWLGVCKYSACAVILFDMRSFISSCSPWVCNPESGHFVAE